ncbi:MAG: hypothetical protein NBV76_05450 [Candidatus Ochrobactrum gambitense]|nr:MAG: hypothetical protein NBV76_05450 [Candidatus Ochrobactrum gambitense]WEK17182.1 MAG: hypothetical protein P0Y54_05510 [Candidatus Ochrobactrum gambitense]
MTSALITRLSKLDAPDREVDALIGKHFFPDEAKSFFDFNAPTYTASVDAAIALAERVLPELSPQVGRNVHHKYWHASVCRINDNMADGIEYYDATHAVPAIALLIALLRAKEALNGIR